MSDVISTTTSVNTILGKVNQLTALTNGSLLPLLNTTINHSRNIHPLVTPLSTPTLKYFGIGINGFYNVDDTNLSQPYLPSQEDMDLYESIPMRIVPIENDLSPIERADYRIRTIERINGVDFVAYWLKLIEFRDTDVNVNRIDLTTNEEEVYTFDASNLNPTPNRNNGVDGVLNVTSKVVVSLDGFCTITGQEVAEAMNIIYGGDFRRARISEFGFYTGEDKLVNALDSQGNSFDYTESIYTQLSTKRCSTGSDLSDPSTIITERISYESGSSLLLG